MSDVIDGATPPTEPAAGSGGSTPPSDPKTVTLTQEKLDRIIASRIAEVKSQFTDYDALREKATKLEELEKAQLSDRERLERERDEAKAAADKALADAQAATLASARLQVALEAGLPVEAAARLQGANADELKADAEALAALLNAGKPAPNPADGFDGGTRREQPNGGGMTREQIQKLARENPHKFNTMVEKGEISLSAL